ncbi:MAG: ABC transporter ATP-binding protein [Acidobacteria bacterium]|nr:ABC transporter ATP-binding protein [Acidobacteriota bacterium]
MSVVDADGLTFTYASGTRPAVRDLSFRIDRGEIFGFLGPSGAGKSTTQKVLIGLLRGYRGTVSVLGRDLAAWGGDYYERIGVSFELPNHYLRLTGAENLGYFRALYRGGTRRPEALLEMVGLADDASRLVSEYSKGMKTRLGVARALLNDPQLIFLDEPTVGLDPASGRSIRDLIREMKQAGRTVFLTTHDMTVADDLCDRVAFIVGGEIRVVESPRTLKLAHGTRTVAVEYDLDGASGRREFPLDGLGDDAGFLTLLRSATIRTLHTQEATLEDVFLRVTGHRLDQGPRPPARARSPRRSGFR